MDNDVSLPLKTTRVVKSVEDILVMKIINLCAFHPYRVIATAIIITIFFGLQIPHLKNDRGAITCLS